MEGDSSALEFSDQASLEDQLLVTPNDETISLSRAYLVSVEGNATGQIIDPCKLTAK